MDPKEAQDLIAKDPRNEAILFPYLNGEDLNSRWDHTARRWIINFHDWPRERAESYEACYKRVLRLVKPERDANKYSKSAREKWWLYERSRPELYAAIAEFDRALVIARISNTGLPQFAATRQVMSEQIVAFAANDGATLALLSSSMHFFWWTIKAASTIGAGAGLRYTPSDGFETFARPALTEGLEQAGEDLDKFRWGVAQQRRIGLTPLYNLVHDEALMDDDLIKMRDIHVAIDEAVRESYALDEELEPAIREYEAKVASVMLPSWREIELGHGFHDTRQGVRFTISAQARADVLDKLLALNHYRYEQEVKQGLHSRKGRGASKKKSTGRTASGTGPALDDGGLFPHEGTLF